MQAGRVWRGLRLAVCGFVCAGLHAQLGNHKQEARSNKAFQDDHVTLYLHYKIMAVSLY